MFFSTVSLLIVLVLIFTFSSFGVNADVVLANYQENHDKLAFSSTQGQASSTTPSTPKTATAGSVIYTDGQVNPFIYFSQIGAPWSDDDYSGNSKKTIGSSGCGPTSFTMVAMSLNSSLNLTPRDVAKYSLDNGFRDPSEGTSFQLFYTGLPHYGLQYSTQELSASAITDTLKKGHLIVMNVGAGKSVEDDRKIKNTWTNGGHFITLRGVTSDNKILVGDPNSEANSNKAWDFDKSLKPFSEGFCIQVWK